MVQKVAALFLVVVGVTMAWSSPARAVEVTQDRFEIKGTTVTQSFLISRPTLVPLSFSYCNGFTCGNPQDPDLYCYVNLYNPNFADNFPSKITITPPQFARPGKVFVRQANTGGGYYAYDPQHPDTNQIDQKILSSQPTFGSDGSITVSFNQGPIQAFKDFTTAKSGSGRVCGISEKQLASFAKQYGTAFDNTAFDTRLTFVWLFDEAPNYANPFDQTVTINGRKLPFKGHLTTQPPPANPTVIPQANAAGTLSAATATLLNNLQETSSKTSWLRRIGLRRAFAASASVIKQSNDVQTALTNANVLNKQGSADWTRFVSYLRDTEKLSVQEVDVGQLISALDQQATPKQVRITSLGLAAYTITDAKSSSRESALVIFGSDGAGNLIVGDPTHPGDKPVKMAYEHFLKGNPWLMLISRP